MAVDFDFSVKTLKAKHPNQPGQGNFGGRISRYASLWEALDKIEPVDVGETPSQSVFVTVPDMEAVKRIRAAVSSRSTGSAKKRGLCYTSAFTANGDDGYVVEIASFNREAVEADSEEVEIS